MASAAAAATASASAGVHERWVLTVSVPLPPSAPSLAGCELPAAELDALGTLAVGARAAPAAGAMRLGM